MKRSKLLFSLCVFIFLFSCKEDKPVIYPIEPHIVLKNLKFINDADPLGNPFDAMIFMLDYTDGDANLGRYPCDTCMHDYNCMVTFYKKKNGNFTLIETDNPLHILIRETPKTSNKSYTSPSYRITARTSYEGEILLKVGFYLTSPCAVGDTLRVTFQVFDNDNNQSNISEMEKVYAYE